LVKEMMAHIKENYRVMGKVDAQVTGVRRVQAFCANAARLGRLGVWVPENQFTETAFDGLKAHAKRLGARSSKSN
jgi:hypothetical protein